MPENSRRGTVGDFQHQRGVRLEDAKHIDQELGIEADLDGLAVVLYGHLDFRPARFGAAGLKRQLLFGETKDNAFALVVGHFSAHGHDFGELKVGVALDLLGDFAAVDVA